MSDCPNAEMRDRLPDLANDALSPAVRTLVVAHVTVCVDCAAEIEILRLARSVMIETTPALNVAAITGALPRPGAAHMARGRTWASWRVAAAVVFLAVGAGSVAVLQQGRPFAGSTDSVAVSAIVSDSSAGLAMTGSLVDLNETELQALIDGLDRIEALPSTEVEGSTVGLSGSGLEVPDSVVRDLEGI